MRSEAEIRADLAKWNEYVHPSIFDADQWAAGGRLAGDVPDLLAEVVRLRGVIDGVRVIRAKVGDEVESDALMPEVSGDE